MAADLLGSLVIGSPTWSLASSLAVISLVLAGIALGLGRAFSSRKLWAWGAEELGQAVINVALLAALIGLAGAASLMVSETLPAQMYVSCASGMPADAHAALNLTSCALSNASNISQRAGAALLSQSYKLGLLSSLSMNLNVVSAQPYQALAWPAKTYAEWAQGLGGMEALIEANRQFLVMMANQGFMLFLPAGLLLRLFFLTRKLGGVLMGGAIAFYLVYPLALATLMLYGPMEPAGAGALSALNANERALAVLPSSLDWDQPGVISAMMKSLDGQDLAANAAGVYGPMASLQGALMLYAVVYPLIALIVSLAAGAGMAGALGAELRMDLMEMA
ncbi:MAG: hypothetical protein M1530_02110 [Candidatus Marsarchaeota archaeon]|nr:hypothetical protein [Candidatus Marsarchaeota archaeon]